MMFTLILTLLPANTDDFSYALASFTFSQEEIRNTDNIALDFSGDGDDDIVQNC